MEFAVDHARTVPARTQEPTGRPLPAAMSDGELLVAIAGGDAGAFEELHGRYRNALLGLAVSRLRDRGRAEDAVQEAFASIWRAASSVRGNCPGPW